jgi:hypothetical protein
VLNTLERNDPGGRYHCVSLREWFDYRGHVCMVFEKLGLSLYDFLRKNSYSPFPAAMVRPARAAAAGGPGPLSAPARGCGGAATREAPRARARAGLRQARRVGEPGARGARGGGRRAQAAPRA